MLTKKFFCPVNGWDCPYWKKDGSCSMVDNGDDPVEKCDDAAYFWDKDGNYFVWEDNEGNLYDEAELLELGFHFVNGEPFFPLDSTFKSKYIKSWQVGEPLREEDFYEEDE